MAAVAAARDDDGHQDFKFPELAVVQFLGRATPICVKTGAKFTVADDNAAGGSAYVFKGDMMVAEKVRTVLLKVVDDEGEIEISRTVMAEMATRSPCFPRFIGWATLTDQIKGAAVKAYRKARCKSPELFRKSSEWDLTGGVLLESFVDTATTFANFKATGAADDSIPVIKLCAVWTLIQLVKLGIDEGSDMHDKNVMVTQTPVDILLSASHQPYETTVGAVRYPSVSGGDTFFPPIVVKAGSMIPVFVDFGHWRQDPVDDDLIFYRYTQPFGIGQWVDENNPQVYANDLGVGYFFAAVKQEDETVLRRPELVLQRGWHASQRAPREYMEWLLKYQTQPTVANFKAFPVPLSDSVAEIEDLFTSSYAAHEPREDASSLGKRRRHSEQEGGGAA